VKRFFVLPTDPINRLKKYGWLATCAAVLFVLASVGFDGHRKEWVTELEMSVNFTAEILKINGCRKERGYGSGSRGVVYLPNIDYQFKYQERSHRSSGYFRSNRSGFKYLQDCERYLNQLDLKRGITVWFDARKPEVSVLDPTVPIPFLEYCCLALASVFFIIFAYFFMRNTTTVDQA
jgi:hypothetical protein